jgi:hypothetical protein
MADGVHLVDAVVLEVTLRQPDPLWQMLTPSSSMRSMRWRPLSVVHISCCH